MRKHIKYPEGVAVVRGNDNAIRMCIDNLKLIPNVEYCDFRDIDYARYLKKCRPDCSDDELQYYLESGEYNDRIYHLYVQDISNIIRQNVIDVLIVNNNEYIQRLMIRHSIWSRNITNLRGINYFINLITKISDQKNNLSDNIEMKG